MAFARCMRADLSERERQRVRNASQKRRTAQTHLVVPYARLVPALEAPSSYTPHPWDLSRRGAVGAARWFCASSAPSSCAEGRVVMQKRERAALSELLARGEREEPRGDGGTRRGRGCV